MIKENNLSKKKIYLVLPSMAGGGAERVASLLLTYLDRDKFGLKLILFNKTGEYLNNLPSDLDIVDLNKKSKRDFLKLIFKLRNILRSENPDIVLSFLEYANIVTVLSGLFLKNNPRIIISERANHRIYLPHAKLGKIKSILMKFTYRKTFKIIAVSKGVKDAIAEDFKIDGRRIEVIYNPVDIAQVKELSKEEVLHPFFENRQNYFVIISTGRLTLQKNFRLLIRAFALVRNIIPCRLIILGQGELKNDLQALSKELKVGEYVDFPGFQKNPFAWIKKADLFVLSSLWEGFPNVLLEAMACGTPVIATRCPSGPDEIISEGKNGLLVPLNDEGTLAETILTLLKRPDLRQRFIEENENKVEEFRAEKIVAQYEKIFEEA